MIQTVPLTAETFPVSINIARLDEQGDARLSMGWETPYYRTDLGHCSFCGEEGRGLFVTKHEWAGNPLGHMLTRCADHQARYEVSLRQVAGG